MGGFNTSVPMPQVGATQLQPVQMQNPLDAVMQWRARQQQLAQGRQQLQLGALQTQEAQLNLEQRKAVNQAYMNAFTPQPDGSISLDKEKLTNALATAGHGEAIPGILEAHTKYQQSLATLKETNQKVAEAEADAAGNLGATIQSANNDPQFFHTLLTHAMKNGIISQDHFGPFDQAITASLQQDPSGESARALVKQYTDRMIAGSPKQQQLANARTTAQGAAQRGQAAVENANRQKLEADRRDLAVALNNARTPEEYTGLLASKSKDVAGFFPAAGEVFDQTGKITPEGAQKIRFGGMNPAEQQAATVAKPTANVTEAELATVATDPNRPPAERAAANAALKRLDQSKLAARPVIQTVIPGLGPGQPGTTSQLSGEEYLKTLPAATANQIRAIAEGRLAMPSASTRSQGALALRQAVMQYEPDFSEQRAQVRKAFTTGPDGKNIGALNTATVHLDQLADAGRAMANGSFRPGNEIWNRTVTMFGGAAPTNFDGLKAAVNSEIASALKGNATDQEIRSLHDTTGNANSPAQLAGAVDTFLHVLGAKLNTYHERYQQQIPGDRVWSPILPSARAVYQKHGFDPTAGPAANVNPGGQGGGQHIIRIGTKRYQYKGAGDTADLKNYTELK